MKEPKIIGIGGVFFKAKAADELQNWYKNQLGLVLNPIIIKSKPFGTERTYTAQTEN